MNHNSQPGTAEYPEHRGHPDSPRAGQRLYFEYHCLESEQSQDAELWRHTKQDCRVVKELSCDECDRNEVGRMFRVRFDDGYEHDAFADELYNTNEGQNGGHTHG